MWLCVLRESPGRGLCLTVPLPQEGMLKDLQKSVEEEEQVWKAKVSATEEELQKVQDWPLKPSPASSDMSIAPGSTFPRN